MTKPHQRDHNGDRAPDRHRPGAGARPQIPRRDPDREARRLPGRPATSGPLARPTRGRRRPCVEAPQEAPELRRGSRPPRGAAAPPPTTRHGAHWDSPSAQAHRAPRPDREGSPLLPGPAGRHRLRGHHRGGDRPPQPPHRHDQRGARRLPRRPVHRHLGRVRHRPEHGGHGCLLVHLRTRRHHPGRGRRRSGSHDPGLPAVPGGVPARGTDSADAGGLGEPVAPGRGGAAAARRHLHGRRLRAPPDAHAAAALPQSRPRCGPRPVVRGLHGAVDLQQRRLRHHARGPGGLLHRLVDRPADHPGDLHGRRRLPRHPGHHGPTPPPPHVEPAHQADPDDLPGPHGRLDHRHRHLRVEQPAHLRLPAHEREDHDRARQRRQRPLLGAVHDPARAHARGDLVPSGRPHVRRGRLGLDGRRHQGDDLRGPAAGDPRRGPR